MFLHISTRARTTTQTLVTLSHRVGRYNQTSGPRNESTVRLHSAPVAENDEWRWLSAPISLQVLNCSGKLLVVTDKITGMQMAFSHVRVQDNHTGVFDVWAHAKNCDVLFK